MKFTVKRLGILTIIAFILSPVISPFPGILLFISMSFLWLSQQMNKSAEITEEITEDKNETEVIDRGDHIVIIEKKIIKKSNLSFEDLRKYNLKNVNCIDICGAYEAPKTRNHYSAGHKHCIMCDKWLIVDSINCPCCSSKLRTKEPIEEEKDIIF